MKKFHYLYKITHIKSKKIYIGIHSTDDLKDRYFANGVYESSDATDSDWVRLNHGDRPHESHIKHALLKYGRNAFKREIVGWFDTREDLITRESEIVTKEFIERDDNFNHRTGGIANVEFSEKVRKKISDNNPMKREDIRKKVSDARKKFWTPERRKKASEENWMKKEENKHLISGENHSFYGKKHTDETKEKISKANKGRVRTKKAITSQRTEIKKYWQDKERVSKRKDTKGIKKPKNFGKNLSQKWKDLVEIEDSKSGKIYHSLKEIQELLLSEGNKKSISTISEYIRGLKGKKTGIDKRFKYVKNPKSKN